MFQYLIIAVVIVLLISIIYWIFIHDEDKNHRRRYDVLYRGSSGNFDKHARAALAELNNIRNPEPKDNFHRAGILQFNLLNGDVARADTQIINFIADDYTDTLLGLQLGIPDNNDHDFMIDQIVNFQNMLMGAGQQITELDQAIEEIVPSARKETIEQRVSDAVATSDSRAEAIEKYFDNSIHYTDNSQNVHDTKVNSDLRVTLNKIKSTYPEHASADTSIAEIHRATRNANVMLALNKISEGNYISTFSDCENNILSYVWERCKHPQNTKNKELMFEAVITALDECVENDILVCINGRCARILNSLVTLDYDTYISEHGAMTFEAYKNQIFQETKEIISHMITRATTSSDERMRKVGNAYIDGDEIDDKEMEDVFKLEIKEEIDNNLANYSDKLSADEIENLKSTCYVYATI